jgi:hypothetical protein
MRSAFAAAFIGLASVSPAAAQMPNVQQMLQGLTTGDQGRDRALQEAFERGYQRGRQDEARQQQSSSRSDRGDRYNRDDRYNSDRSRAYDPSYAPQGSGRGR